MQDVDNVLYDAFGQRQVSTMYTGLNQYYVVMEVDPQYQRDPDSLKNIYIKSSNGTAGSALCDLSLRNASHHARREPLRRSIRRSR